MTGTSIPELRKTTAGAQLYVRNHPFLALGGELGNSTASDAQTLELALEKCGRMGLNTVMLPAYWDLVEPSEGTFDFSLVRVAIDRARERHIHLVLLWFGTWKNSMSCYAPGWVKRDTSRFPRAKLSSGEPVEIISPASTAACDADARAFAGLMAWIREYDAAQQTVIMAQVENEIGMIPEARDHSAESERAYRAAVPEKILRLVRFGKLGPELNALWEAAGRHDSGSWPDVFGTTPEAEEVFSAWQFSTYTEKVASAGKREYPIPMCANAALIRAGYKPGQYPSAGPLPHLLEIWRAGAPSLDMICPDIYFPNFAEWAEKYVRNGNPLFIPEMAASARAMGNAVYAIGHLGAMGVGPFSIENADPDREAQVTQCYALLRGLSQTILTCQRDGKILGLSPQVAFDWTTNDDPQHGTLANITFEAKFDRPNRGGATDTTTLPTLGAGRWDAPSSTPLGAALILQLTPEEFLILGNGVVITFVPTDGPGKIGIDQVQEGTFTDAGEWRGARYLNGDETHQGRHVRLYEGRWSIQRVKLYRY